MIERTLTSTPATHWSLRSMAKEAGLTSIWRIWGAFGLHRAETFKLSRDPHFVDKVRDILSPLDRALGVDEKS